MDAILWFGLALHALVVLVAGGFMVAVARASPETLPKATVGVGVWLGVPAFLAALDLLSFETSPPTMLVLMGVLTIGTFMVALGGLGRRMAAGLPLAVLVGYQAFRIPVELWLHRGSELGLFPVEMTYDGWNYDIVTGITALLLGLALWRGLVGKGLVWIWNLMGLGLLLTIVTIAILSAPVPFSTLETDPPNVYVLGFPGVWLPVVLVQAALLGHLLVFRSLTARS